MLKNPTKFLFKKGIFSLRWCQSVGLLVRKLDSIDWVYDASSPDRPFNYVELRGIKPITIKSWPDRPKACLAADRHCRKCIPPGPVPCPIARVWGDPAGG
jgi:hypothetical protein